MCRQVAPCRMRDMRSGNWAARAGSWSARHRRAAVLGWILFVLLAGGIGSAVGTIHIKDEDQGNGEARTAQRAIAKAGLKDRASEQVLVETRGALKVTAPGFRAAILDVQRRLAANRYVTQLDSPFTQGNAGQVSTDQRAALVLFQIRGTKDQAEDRVGPILDSVTAAQRAHPQLRIEEVGDASADKALT